MRHYSIRVEDLEKVLAAFLANAARYRTPFEEGGLGMVELCVDEKQRLFMMGQREEEDDGFDVTVPIDGMFED